MKKTGGVDKSLPPPISLGKMLGPSFIILALGLGSGEVILWPYLSSNYGLGLVWGALLGITFQFFINMEIERYALVKGESVFVGLKKLFTWAPVWFIASTFIGFGLPGIIAASAKVLATIFGLEEFRWIAIFLLLAIGAVLTLSKTVYARMEKITKTIIILGIPFLIVLVLLLSTPLDWSDLASGIIGQGYGYWFLPPGIALATFFAAFAYSGAGGNLNLTQSIYIKEKGYGMGKYARSIAGLFQDGGKDQLIQLEGVEAKPTKENVERFKKWWKLVNTEHLLVFWFLGFIGICMLMMLAYVTTFGITDNAEGILFVIHEGYAIQALLAPWVGTLFLVIVAIMLFQTQLGVLDSTSRIMAENFALQKLQNTTKGSLPLSKIYFSFLWAQIAFGIILFLFNISEPRTLIVFGAVLNAIAMFVHIGLVARLNRDLAKPFRPAAWRTAIIGVIFTFFGIFSIITVIDSLQKLL